MEGGDGRAETGFGKLCVTSEKLLATPLLSLVPYERSSTRRNRIDSKNSLKENSVS